MMINRNYFNIEKTQISVLRNHCIPEPMNSATQRLIGRDIH